MKSHEGVKKRVIQSGTPRRISGSKERLLQVEMLGGVPLSMTTLDVQD